MGDLYSKALDLDPLHKPPACSLVGLGIFAAAAAEVSTYPLYLVKTNLQAGHGRHPWEVGRQIVVQCGISGLYRGVEVSAMKSVPSSCVAFLVYDRARALCSFS